MVSEEDPLCEVFGVSLTLSNSEAHRYGTPEIRAGSTSDWNGK